MKIGIMQPYFFPYIGYWQLMNMVDRYVIYDDVNFIKNGWINRNNILLNGEKHLITLPLQGASPFLPINQIKITSNQKILEKLLKTMEQAYRKAPFYNEIYPIVEETVMEQSKNLSSALIGSFFKIREYLGMKTELIVSSELKKQNELKGKDKVMHICSLLGGDEYVNAIGGQELYDKAEFASHGIKLNFLKTGNVEYKQFKNDFVPNLSIIDILMFNSPKEVNRMLGEYELV